MPDDLFARRYRLLDILGTGSNGPVWRSFDENLGRDVALKRFRPGEPNIVAYDEASILTQLASDHILRVSNADTFEDIPYVATDVAASTAARALADDPWGLAPDRVLQWSKHALVGLGVTHAYDLVHRDVKPENLFLDRYGRALLGDFGLARRDDGSGVPVGGTPRVRAPEMLIGGRGTAQSDLYSLAVTMYRLLTGAWPFDTEGAVTSGAFERIRILAPHVPRRLADRVERALRVDLSVRYQTAREMSEALAAPNLIGRVWMRRQPHTGHRRCWTELGNRGGKTTVCEWIDGGRGSVEVRRSTAAASRVVPLCREGIPLARLPRTIADTFDALVSRGR